jgi:hypothetical protein
VSRYRVYIGGTIDLDAIPGYDPNDPRPIADQLEGTTSEAFLRAINAYEDTNIAIGHRPAEDDLLEELVAKRGLGGWV